MLILRRRRDGRNSPGEIHCVCCIIRSNLVFRSLAEIEKRSEAILEKNAVVGFLDKMKDSQEVVSLVDELRNAILGYQVSETQVVLPRVNTRGIALTAAVNVQPDWKTSRKVTHRYRQT